MDDQGRTIQKQGEQIRKLRKEVKNLVDENHNLAAVFRIEFENLREFMKSKFDIVHEEIDGLAEDIDYIKTKSASTSRHLKSLAKGLKLPSEQFMSDTDNNFFKRSARHSRGRKPRKTEFYRSLDDLPKYTYQDYQNYPYQPKEDRRRQVSSSSSSGSGDDTVEPADTSLQSKDTSLQSYRIQNVSRTQKPVTTPRTQDPTQFVTTGSQGRRVSSSGSETMREASHTNQLQQEPVRNVEVPVTNVTTTISHSNSAASIQETPESNVPITTTKAPISMTATVSSMSSVTTATTILPPGGQSDQNLGNRQRYMRPNVTEIKLNFDDPESYMKSAHLEITAETRQAIQQTFQRDDHAQSKPEGLYTVLLVDTSQSMDGEPLLQTKKFLIDFIDEVENSAAYNNLEENVAVITFGRDTCIKQRFTNDYGNIRDVIDKLQTGGRTPLFTGLAMCINYIRGCGKTVQVTSAVNLTPRIILITDGCVTDDSNFTGVDHEPNSIKCQSNVLTFLSAIKQYDYPLIRVGIGEYNRPFLDDFPCSGVMTDTSDVLYLARYYLYQTVVGQVIAENDEVGGHGDIPELVKKAVQECENFSNRDLGKIGELLQTHGIQFNSQWFAEPGPDTDGLSDEQSDGELLEEFGIYDKFARLLPVGTRVKRGQDWEWGDQDGNGPGTVVAHKDQGELVVKWDTGEINVYFYNHNGLSHVTKCDASRILKPGENIEVGCSVRRGKDWNRTEEDGGSGTVGIVIRKHRDKKVSVRWPSQVVETYSHGCDNRYEVEIVERTDFSAYSDDTMNSGGIPDDATGGETEYAWQWKDESNQWRTFPNEEAAKLESFHVDKKSGTVMINHYSLQLRCDPTKMMYRQQGGGDHKGEIRRFMFSKSELENLHMLELTMLQS